ncbi:phage major capsid protein [Kurthia gibsonii]|uniref:phage major capsid protein n=1 Tax=Kurthia gibsonii TaxID=33946 RepID=UPI003F22CFD2
MKTKEELLARKKEIAELLADETRSITDLDAIEKELRDINDDLAAIEKREFLKAEAAAINDGSHTESRTIATFKSNEFQAQEDDAEKRAAEIGKDLIENRTVTVTTGKVVLPKTSSTTINGSFNQISSLIDAVNTVPLMGGESHAQPYEKTHGEGEYTAEGTDYTDAETVTDYALINKSKITAYSEHTEEVEKLPAANYAAVVQGGIGKALRSKITKQILVGEGGADKIVGIFSAQAKAIDPATDKEIAKVDEKTLDEIIYSYGGDEDVEEQAVLILNKADVKAFATLRTADGKKVYDVKSYGNTGIIDGIPYLINSACKALDKALAGEYVMAYGVLKNYELAVFSDTDIQRSSDYKFKQGIISHRGSVFVGGNVVAHNGFLRLKKAAAV